MTKVRTYDIVASAIINLRAGQRNSASAPKQLMGLSSKGAQEAMRARARGKLKEPAAQPQRGTLE